MTATYQSLYGSISTNLTFKGFDLSVMTTYSLGGKIYDGLYSGSMNPLYVSGTWNRNALRRWAKPGDITDVPRVQLGTQGAASDRYLIDASYFAIKNNNRFPDLVFCLSANHPY